MKKDIIIFDLDGVLCDITHRLPLIECANPKWEDFYLACKYDKIIPATQKIFWAMQQMGYKSILMSGRGEIARKRTERWLSDALIYPYEKLYLRPNGDHSADWALKSEWYERADLKDRVLCVFEDRLSVVKMWRAKGLTVFQNAEGNF